MADNDRVHLDRLTALVRPVPLLDLVTCLCRWLQDAHEAAADLQPLRRGNRRGNWHNNTSFGTDRYQYLLSTASSLTADLPDLEVAPAFQTVLLKLERVGIYQFQAASGPYGSFGDASELRRELFATSEEQALLSRTDAWLGGRAQLLLPWSGTEEHGLTDAWIGQGGLEDNRITWSWLIRLQDVAGRDYGLPGQLTVPMPLDPNAFDQPQPALPMRPRTEAPSGSTAH